MGQRVKLVYEGPGQTSNLDVAGETGDARLEPGREIEVSAELAKQLEASTPYWRRRGKAAANAPVEGDSGGEG